MKEILSDLKWVLLKIVIVAGSLAVIFTWILGICRCKDDQMNPSFQPGDLILYYRLDLTYRAGEAVVVRKNGEQQIQRIIAKEGDTVDITEEGLWLNGYLQQENHIYTETCAYKEGIRFPVTLGKDEYFVLSDNRTDARDSRVNGALQKSEIDGSVINILRNRNF